MAPRRLLDLPGFADLETRALMKPSFAEPQARAEFPEIDQLARDTFGLTADEAAAIPDPEGWDVMDDKRRPLRILGHFSHPLWLALRGVAGHLPFEPQPDEHDPSATSLAAEAAKFRRDKR